MYRILRGWDSNPERKVINERKTVSLTEITTQFCVRNCLSNATLRGHNLAYNKYMQHTVMCYNGVM